MADAIFHVVSEDVMKENVSTYMKNVGVKKYGREEGVKIVPLNYFGWNHSEIVEEPVRKQIYSCVLWKKCEEQ